MAKDEEKPGKALDDSGVDPEDPNPVTGPDEPTAARDGATVHELPDRKGRPVDEQERPAETEEQDDGQIAWVVEEAGKKITLGQLVQRGTPVLYHYSMAGKAVPDSQGGLMDPYATTVPLVVDGVPEDVKVSYVRNGDRSVKEVHVYMKITPRVVYQARSEAAKVYLRELDVELPPAASS